MSPATALSVKETLPTLTLGRCGMYVLAPVRQRCYLRTCASHGLAHVCKSRRAPVFLFVLAHVTDRAPHFHEAVLMIAFCLTVHRDPPFRRRYAKRHGAKCVHSNGKWKDPHWVNWKCVSCSPLDLEAPDEKDIEDPTRCDAWLLQLHTFARRALLQVASRVASTRVRGLLLCDLCWDLRTCASPHFLFDISSLAPPCGVARCRDAPSSPVYLCTSRRPFYACNEHRYSSELHGGYKPTDMEQLLNKNLNRGYFCDACGVMHQNGKKVRARFVWLKYRIPTTPLCASVGALPMPRLHSHPLLQPGCSEQGPCRVVCVR